MVRAIAPSHHDAGQLQQPEQSHTDFVIEVETDEVTILHIMIFP